MERTLYAVAFSQRSFRYSRRECWDEILGSALAMPQNPKWLPWGPKMADSVWKGVQPYVNGHTEQLLLNRFFNPSISSVRNIEPLAKSQMTTRGPQNGQWCLVRLLTTTNNFCKIGFLIWAQPLSVCLDLVSDYSLDDHYSLVSNLRIWKSLILFALIQRR